MITKMKLLRLSRETEKNIKNFTKRYNFDANREVWMTNDEVVCKIYREARLFHNLPYDEKASAREMLLEIERLSNQDNMALFDEHPYSADPILKAYRISGHDDSPAILQKSRVKLDSIVNNVVGLMYGPGNSIHATLVGSYYEEECCEQISNALASYSAKIYKNYRHGNTGNPSFNTSENDLLVVTKKGIFTFEIKATRFDRFEIYDSGAVKTEPNIDYDVNPAEQASRHVNSLYHILGSVKSTRNRIYPVIYLSRCDVIDNHSESFLAYRSAGPFMKKFNELEECFTDEEYEKIIEILENNKHGEARFRYMYGVNDVYSAFVSERAVFEPALFTYNVMNRKLEKKAQVRFYRNLLLKCVLYIALFIGYDSLEKISFLYPLIDFMDKIIGKIDLLLVLFLLIAIILVFGSLSVLFDSYKDYKTIKVPYSYIDGSKPGIIAIGNRCYNMKYYINGL